LLPPRQSRGNSYFGLAERDHLAAGQFTVADLNVASILVWGKMGRLNLSPYPKVAAMAGQLFGAACLWSRA
jgi:hypothetical protein